MNKKIIEITSTAITILVMLFIIIYIYGDFGTPKVSLPKPLMSNTFSLNNAILQRRSVRGEFQDKNLSMEQVSTLLWAADGITDKMNDLRSAPSAGDLYPIDLYVAKKNGVWIYNPKKNNLTLVKNDDVRMALSNASQKQPSIAKAAMIVVMVTHTDRARAKHGVLGPQFCYIEAGHIAQNLALQATALGLGSTPIGAFVDNEISKTLQLSPEQNAIYIVAVGEIHSKQVKKSDKITDEEEQDSSQADDNDTDTDTGNETNTVDNETSSIQTNKFALDQNTLNNDLERELNQER